jgi:Ca2+-binding EF-hand superfamily protein
MAEKYASARSCFSAIDQDRSGTVERGELARGLFMLGVWLRPTELQTLFESVDKDNGGDVDFSEFEYFWNTW